MLNSEETDFNIKVPRIILVQCVSLLVYNVSVYKEVDKKKHKRNNWIIYMKIT